MPSFNKLPLQVLLLLGNNYLIIMIEIKGIKKTYANGTHALNDVNLMLDKKVTSIIGRNGAGKTTLLRILSTQLLPTSGTVLVNGHDIINDVSAIREMTVSIPQEARLIYYRNAFDSVRLYLGARGAGISEASKKAEKALKTVGLWEWRNHISEDLSGGMKRKVFVAMALAADSELVILDEPTTGLDPLSRFEVWSAIKKLKGQVIITTHYMEEAQALSDEIVMMDHGKVLSQGKISDLLRDFAGMVRIESARKSKGSKKVAGMWVSYAKKKEAEQFVMRGDIVKQITLDDLFIKMGVDIES
jgi:ABC-2 type transport system ATP-binding protein